MGWAGDNGDPDNFLTPQFSCASVKSGLNFARYCDPGLDKLIADGKAASSQEQRTGLYHQAQKLIHEQALWLPWPTRPPSPLPARRCRATRSIRSVARISLGSP